MLSACLLVKIDGSILSCAVELSEECISRAIINEIVIMVKFV